MTFSRPLPVVGAADLCTARTPLPIFVNRGHSLGRAAGSREGRGIQSCCPPCSVQGPRNGSALVDVMCVHSRDVTGSGDNVGVSSVQASHTIEQALVPILFSSYKPFL